MMKFSLKPLTMVALLGGAAFVMSCGGGAMPEGEGAQAEGEGAQAGGDVAQAVGDGAAPSYAFDPGWPKPLPNKWKMGGITGLAVDADDNIWVLTRPNDMRDIELLAELTPPGAECCVRPHTMIHFDQEGNVIGSFDPQQGHGMDVDSEGFVYIGQDTVRKYDPNTGEVVGEVPRAPEREGGRPVGLLTRAPIVPGRGGPGPTGTYPQPPRGGGGGDPAARAAAAEEAAAFLAKYPPTTPMIVGQIEEVRIDESANELYATDNYFGRVMVFDLTTFEFKRGWGAYGHTLSEISTDDADREYTPGGEMQKEFGGHLTLNISNDGLVYAADRNGNRVQVFNKDGTYVKEFSIGTMTSNIRPARGTAGGVAFSGDPEQRVLFVSDITNNKIWFLNREDGEVLGSIGQHGENGGQFFGLHMIANDSQGNIYTGEVFNGERVQRFVPVN